VANNWIVRTFGHNLNELVLKTCLQKFNTKNFSIEYSCVQCLNLENLHVHVVLIYKPLVCKTWVHNLNTESFSIVQTCVYVKS
jgi:hypothetical protein